MRAAALAALVALTACAQYAEPLRVTTFNVRYGTARDGENSWPNRRELVLEVLRRQAPHVLGLQEALAFQMEAIGGALPHTRALGVDRRGGDEDEYSSLLVDERRLTIEEHGQFWLSETPDTVGSVGWDAALPRICTWAVLLDEASGRRFQVFNTHFDHVGARARRMSAELIVQHAALRDLPAVVMGDLNAGEHSPPLDVFREAGFRDTWRLVHPDADEPGTFTDFREVRGTRKIDHVLVRGPWLVTDAEIVLWQQDGRFPSDHLPVTAALEPKEMLRADSSARPRSAGR